MCGIFGLIRPDNYTLSESDVHDMREVVKNLLHESERRGRDASGICVVSDGEAHVYKDDVTGSILAERPMLNKVLEDKIGSSSNLKCVLGHTRAQTKGSSKFNVNNHPIIANGAIGVHNGMIHNDDELFVTYKKKLDRMGAVDTEIIFRLLDMYITEGETIVSAVRKTVDDMHGWYACAFIHADYPDYVTLFKDYNTPVTIYEYEYPEVRLFASDERILDEAIDGNLSFREQRLINKIELGREMAMRVNVADGKVYHFSTKYSHKSHKSSHPAKAVGYNSPAATFGHSFTHNCGMLCDNEDGDCFSCPHSFRGGFPM